MEEDSTSDSGEENNPKKESTKEDSNTTTTDESDKCDIPALTGLSNEERITLLKSCVALIEVPVDADALNAVLRLVSISYKILNLYLNS